jgi:hypothetical protein
MPDRPLSEGGTGFLGCDREATNLWAAAAGDSPGGLHCRDGRLDAGTDTYVPHGRSTKAMVPQSWFVPTWRVSAGP